LKDLDLFVQQSAGDEVEENISCDSEFMMRIMPEVGRALRAAYHWLPMNETIYLVMDNAGGHGSNEATAQYTQLLWTDFKVQVVWQVPRSPETNMLDLGIWMSVQAAVSRVHHKRQYHPDALAQSVKDAWDNYLSPNAFKNVHGRLRIVLHCIVEDNGGNNIVEQKRGNLFRDSVIEIKDEDDNEDNNKDDESVDMISISDD
jgi:DNA-binding protein Fis